jgi:predicted metal-dependent hydrolase
MNTDTRIISVSGIKVEVVRKEIKNLHLGVYPPNGRVRVAVPNVVSDDAVRLAVVEKLGWIKRQKAKFAAQPRQSQREMVNGESHYFLGKRYRLRVHECTGNARAAIRGKSTLDLFIPPHTSPTKREAVLSGWYREQLRSLIPPLIEEWQTTLGVAVSGWQIRKMKTKWGSCNPSTQRITLNLELAKKPEICLEYIVVHEMIHILESRHNDRFVEYLDKFMPQWRLHRDQLNQSPLARVDWKY